MHQYEMRLIGEYDMTSDKLELYYNNLEWGPYNWTYQEITGVPFHRCSALCPVAHVKVMGDLLCCWQCHLCRNNEFLFDNETCKVCPDKQWPVDENQLDCSAIEHTFLTWDNLYGVTLATLSCFGLFLTTFLTVIIVSKKDRRVIKGSGLQMVLVILVGIYLAFATVFAHIAKPIDGLCIFGRIGFHLSFTLIFGPMLVKTNRIFQVFFAASKLSRKVFMGSERSQQVALFTILAVQVQYTKLRIMATICVVYFH